MGNHDKHLREQEMVNRNQLMKPKAFGGAGMRWELAADDHNKRMKCKGKKPPEAFWTALPTGWGFPPSYINFNKTAAESHKQCTHHGPLSARASPEPRSLSRVSPDPLHSLSGTLSAR